MFKNLSDAIQQQFAIMAKTERLFKSSITGKELWECYLSSFEGNTNPVFRDPESSAHNCNNCNNFIRRYGNIVTINEDGKLITLFSALNVEAPYKVVAESMDALLKNSVISDVFLETFASLNKLPYESCKKNQNEFQLGVASNFKQYNKAEAEMYGVVKEGDVKEFNHFNLKLPAVFVDKSGASIEALMAGYRDKYSVFKRAMVEIPLDTLSLVKDLINQGSLLDGTAHLHSIDEISLLKEVYEKNKTDNWIWWVTYSMDERVAKFKNTLIGVLCAELAEGLELNKACTNWNKRVDPVNYHKATAPISQKQINEAQKFVSENGYETAFNRRLATIDDIKASEILHINSGDGKIKEVSVFDNVKATSTQHKRAEFDNVQEISIEKFMSDILPACSSIEAYLKNNHEGNLSVLTISNHKDSKQIFKWNNPYSYTFNGNLAGKSQIEDMINSRGGTTDGVLNIRLHFPNSTTDYDLCVSEPKGQRITYNYVRQTFPSSGRLDLDAQGVDGNYPPEKRVENINYTDVKKMPIGNYSVEIDNYGGGSDNGFIMEIKTFDSISRFEFSGAVNGKLNKILSVNFDGKGFTINNLHSNLVVKESEVLTKELWNLETNNFHKVNLVCLTPNHWGENEVGNKHYMFMLNDCKTENSIRGFHNENLLPELLKHKKVMEVLGATNTIQPNGSDYLAGVGFNATVRDELIVKCKGSHNRMLKIKF